MIQQECFPSTEQKQAIWKVLVIYGGAEISQREDFMQHWPECEEYRFQGRFGFGGKIRWNSGCVFATYYSEDKTDYRDAAIAILNAKLAQLVQGCMMPDSEDIESLAFATEIADTVNAKFGNGGYPPPYRCAICQRVVIFGQHADWCDA